MQSIKQYKIDNYNLKFSKVLLIIILLSLYSNLTSFAQIIQTPRIKSFYENLNGSRFSNRPLGYLNDASSVAYNPSMLGLRNNDGDLMFVMPSSNFLVDSLSTTEGTWGAFAKISAFSIGYHAGNDVAPTELYLGFAMPLKSESLYLGLSATALKNKGEDINFEDTRINSSILFVPFKEMLVSAGVTNMHRLDSRYYVLYSQGVLSPFDWLSLHYDAKYSEGLLFENAHSGKDVVVNTGISLSLAEDMAFSTMYNLSTENIRIGFEWGLGIGIGLFGDTKASRGRSSNYDLLLRFSSDDYLSHSDLAEKGTLTTLKDACYPDAYFWNINDGLLTPPQLYSKMRVLGGDYSDFVDKLAELSPNENEVFTNIAKNYYPLSYIPKENTNLKLSSLIQSKGNYSVYEEKSTQINENETSVILKVKDITSSNVSGLRKENFNLNNPNLIITKFEETTSETKHPVDIVFIVDASGSMSDEIASIKKNIENFANQLEIRGVDSRLGGMLFGNTILRTIDLTSNFSQFKNEISKFNYDNNAYAECTSLAITEATSMGFRDNAEKIIVVVTDECMMQSSSDINEFDLTQTLWKKGIKLYSMVNYVSHNGGFVTKFTLGKDYDIRSPFNEILDKIAGDVSTTYELVYAPKPKETPKVLPKYTAITGEVRDIDGWKVATDLVFKTTSGKVIRTKTNAINGKYFTLIDEGEDYIVEINTTKYMPLVENVNLTKTIKGDTIKRDFVLQIPNSILSGYVLDENNRTTTAEVVIKDNSTGKIVNLKTNSDGYYQTEIEVGKLYTLSAKKPEYINIPVEFDTKNNVRGENFKRDLQVIEILAAIEKGLTFKMNNILFDTGKWDIKPESEVELQKLVDFMTEYSTIKVEIGAHTDNVGKDDANMTLSANRAASVVTYLITKGIDSTKLTSKGYGETTPIGDNNTPEGRQLNRRVEFKLIK